MTKSRNDIGMNSVFQTNVFVDNFSNQDATGIQAVLEIPQGAIEIHTSNLNPVPFTLSQGTFDFDNLTWDVGDLPKGNTAVLTISWVRKTRDEVTGYAQITEQDQLDWYSTPNNGICCSPAENDETFFELSELLTSVNDRNTEEEQLNYSTSLHLEKVFPSPAFELINLQIQSAENRSTEIQIFDLYGKTVLTKETELSEGKNDISIDISALNASTYFVVLKPFHPHLRQAKFIKMRD